MAKLINEEINKTQKDKMTKKTGFFLEKIVFVSNYGILNITYYIFKGSKG